MNVGRHHTTQYDVAGTDYLIIYAESVAHFGFVAFVLSSLSLAFLSLAFLYSVQDTQH